MVLYSDKSPVTDDGTAVQVAIVSGGGGGGGGGDASAANQEITNTRLGTLTETAPATDTASSGLNGRLQRVAQRLTALIGLLPTSLGPKTPANSLAVAPTLPAATTATIATLQTNATGANFAAFTSAACSSLEIFNNTGTAIEYRRGGTGATFPILNGTSRLIIAIANANEISIRRVDQSNTQVSIAAEIFV